MESAKRRTPVGWLIDHPWAIILTVVAIAFGLWVKGTRSSDYEVSVMFDEATNLYSGLDVRVDGLDAGKITGVEQRDGQAIVKLGLTDDDVYPLHEGTTATLRFGTTIGNGTRQIDLDPGPKTNPEIKDGGIIRNGASVEATEFDQVFDTFDAKTRKAFQGAMKGTGDTFGPRVQEIREGVDTSAEGLTAFGSFADELTADTPALRALVANTDRATRAIAARRDDLSSLVQVASATFETFANNTRGITGSLDRFPETMREMRTTLARLDGTVAKLDPLMADLKPGAKELALLSRDLRPALADLRETVPSAVSAFRTVRTSAPDITTFLETAQPFSAKAAPALTRLAPMVACIRPYAPEIASFVNNWAGWSSFYDSISSVARIQATVSAATSFTDNVNLTAKDVESLGEKFALIRPPGFAAGRPQFNPECGITEKGITASQDPEAGK